MDANGGDLACVAKADKGPGFASVDGFINASADRHVAADFRGAGAGEDDVGVGERNLACAHGGGGEVTVGDVVPGVACVGGFPDASAGGSHVEGVGLGWDAGN